VEANKSRIFLLYHAPFCAAPRVYAQLWGVRDAGTGAIGRAD
jgi:hypothetical protein